MNKYMLTSDFVAIDETEGILQNYSMTTVEYAVSDSGTPTKDTGLLIRPNQKLMYQLDGANVAYVRSIRVAARDKTPYVNVVANACCGGEGGGGGTTTETIREWKAGATYKKGDFVVYNGQLYEVKTTHTAGSTFNTNNFTIIGGGGGTTIEQWAKDTSYSAGDFVIYNNTLYQCSTDHTSGSTFDTSKWVAISNEKGTILPDFKANEIYEKNDMIYKNGHIYRAKNNFTSGSTFKVSDWEDVTFQYTLPIASTSTLGGIKIGNGLTVASDGTVSTTFDGDFNSLTNKPTCPTYSDMVGATSSTDGVHGLVPQPDAGDEGKFLRGDGTWQTVSGSGGYTLPIAGAGVLGGVKVGNGLAISSTGVLSCTCSGGGGSGNAGDDPDDGWTDSDKDVIYGFRINNNESDPYASVTYLLDAIGRTPCKMDYANDVFFYGSWENAFFMPKPCMLKSDGTVDYYLDVANYAYRDDGVTASDIANDSYDGNAMMEWGQNGRKIYYKVVNVGDAIADVFIANHKADSNYECYSFINADNEEVDHFYTPIYNGSLVGSKLRSLSGKVPIQSKTAQQEVAYATANGDGWYTEVYADRVLINFLLILMGKSLNTQSVFGLGNSDGYVNSSSSNYGMINSGTMNTKGLFWGDDVSSTSNRVGVKVFGMENWYGNQWRRTAGLINVNGVVKAKMTRGTYDGSLATDYNFDGTDYTQVCTVPAILGKYINRMNFSKYGLIFSGGSGTSSTYYCDGGWSNNTQIDYALFGCACYNSLLCGAFCSGLGGAPSDVDWYRGASLSKK